MESKRVRDFSKEAAQLIHINVTVDSSATQPCWRGAKRRALFQNVLLFSTSKMSRVPISGRVSLETGYAFKRSQKAGVAVKPVIL